MTIAAVKAHIVSGGAPRSESEYNDCLWQSHISISTGRKLIIFVSKVMYPILYTKTCKIESST
jgi:hypothetical protein